jgi:Amt family ammonium transporter
MSVIASAAAFGQEAAANLTPGLFPKDAPAAAAMAAGFANNAWLLAATALIFFMTIPGLALFYGGLVKRKNVLNLLMQCFACAAIVSVVWVAFGFSLVFSDKELVPGLLGDFKFAFLNNIGTADSGFWISQPNAPVNSLIFVMFQAMFAVITPGLIIGAYAERFRFPHFVAFTVAWLILVYAPIAHAVWNPSGFLYKLGALDFAGGTVVHISAGFAGIAAALILGKRKPMRATPPHNLTYTVLGAGMLWFGWFGFNAGSGLAADGIAGNAFVVTNTAAATAALVWAIMDWVFHKKPTVLGVATGAVGGLVAITPAAGFVNVSGAFAIGIAVAVVCWFMVVKVKAWLKYDDALDCFGVHGIGGLIGSLLVGLLADPAVWKPFGGSYAGLAYGNPGQFLVQLEASAFSIAWTLVVSSLILLALKAMGAVATESEQAVGLDIIEHSERAYTVIE